MILVVRQNYVDKGLLNDTVRQLKMNNANIIGFVLTCAQAGQKYYKYRKYGKYGKYYSKEAYDPKAREAHDNDEISVTEGE